ncbi:MAG: ATP-dependent helicase [Woeseiaceae bacterium]|nr:ATP-dependent helicase [Woeseiaceae bacterium]
MAGISSASAADRPDPAPVTLNAAQRRAAAFGEYDAGGRFRSGPLLIIAGAGTGKTMTLAHRVAHLVVAGVAPERILLLTFTRRAAETMCRRVDAILRRELERQSAATRQAGRLPWSGTFHSVANRLLRRFAHNVGLDPGFSVLDRGDAADLLDVVRHDMGLSTKARRFPKKDTCLAIYSRRVNTQGSLEETLASTFPWCAEWAAELNSLFRGYVERKQRTQSLDYDDLLLYWKHLVAEDEFAERIGGYFDHVLVDEYQDTNRVQADILAALKPDGDGITVVGDDAQSIYSFRAANVDNILDFPDRYLPPAEVITLEQNYRSTQSILDAANRLIAEAERQYRKNLFSDIGRGEKPAYVTVEDGDAEVDYVVRAVLANREAGLALKRQAVLFRGAHSSDRLELELVRRNIPYVKYGGLKFLEAAHVKDLLALLKWAENPKNDVAAFRVLKLLPGMGPVSARKCIGAMHSAGGMTALAGFRPPPAAADEWPAFCALMQALSSTPLDEGAWVPQLSAARRWYQPQLERLYDAAETRMADLEQLEQIAARYPTRERFLTELTLDPPAATGDRAGDPLLDEDYLVLSTVHSAKGQEWDAVFVLNVTDGSFPSEFSTGQPALVEEERRLLYVAMTRARQSLSLIAPLKFHVTQQPRHGDRHVFGAESRFMTAAVLNTMTRTFHGEPDAKTMLRSRSATQIDVATRLREMW